MHITSQIWAPEFRTAISLLGQASDDLPIGSSEPILAGAAAMALYSGGLWRSNDIELIMDTPRPRNRGKTPGTQVQQSPERRNRMADFRPRCVRSSRIDP